MEVLVFLVPLALTLGLIGLMGFLWSLKNGQYDDLEGAGWRAIADDEPPSRSPVPERELMASLLSGERDEAVSSDAGPAAAARSAAFELSSPGLKPALDGLANKANLVIR